MARGKNKIDKSNGKLRSLAGAFWSRVGKFSRKNIRAAESWIKVVKKVKAARELAHGNVEEKTGSLTIALSLYHC